MELPVVLIVDDNPDTEKIFKLWFKKLYLIVGAGSLQEAVDTFDSIRVDVAIIDYGLPDGTGLQLLSLIPNEVLTILTTGDHNISQELGHLFDAAFPKPYNCEEIGNFIQEYFNA